MARSYEPGSGARHVTADKSIDARRWLALAVLGVVQLMVVLDATVMNIALPDAQRALYFSDANRQWVVTGYSVAFGSLLLLGGRLSDLFGRRATFIAGLVGFGIASVVGGAAVNFEMLVAARVGQGLFAALLSPTILSLLTATFHEPGERAKAFGVIGAIAGMGAAVGLLLGGSLTQGASWRWALYVNVAFVVAALIGTFLALSTQVVDQKPTLDVPGTVTVTAALFSIVYGLSEASSKSWTDASTIGFLIAGVVLLAVFLVSQTRVANPILPLRILMDRTRTGAYLAMFILGIGMFAIFLFLIYYLQLNLRYSPIRAGIAFLPMVAAIIIASTTAPTLLLPRLGAKITVGSGFVLSAAGMATLTRIGLKSQYVSGILPGLLLFGLGMGAVISVALHGSSAGVDQADTGIASAMVNMAQQVGGAIGIALLSTIAVTAQTEYLEGRELTPIVQAQAQIHSYTTTFWWATAIFVIGGLIVVALLPNALPASAAEA
ncbi:MFS transporter [Nocardia sp. NPDC051570]|uniref:MFS transporter n=1 Tax=Nocardia sp. NPDC051570 TaxID=3364324 RepID=UPI0037B2F432